MGTGTFVPLTRWLPSSHHPQLLSVTESVVLPPDQGPTPWLLHRALHHRVHRLIPRLFWPTRAWAKRRRNTEKTPSFSLKVKLPGRSSIFRKAKSKSRCYPSRARKPWWGFEHKAGFLPKE